MCIFASPEQLRSWAVKMFCMCSSLSQMELASIVFPYDFLSVFVTIATDYLEKAFFVLFIYLQAVL